MGPAEKRRISDDFFDMTLYLVEKDPAATKSAQQAVLPPMGGQHSYFTPQSRR